MDVFLFFSIVFYTLWLHNPESSNNWENIWGFFLLLFLIYLTVVFGLQAIIIHKIWRNRQEFFALSHPKSCIPTALRLNQSSPELLAELRIPRILLGLELSWYLQLEDTDTKQKLVFQSRLQSGWNHSKAQLNIRPKGVYRGPKYCLKVRDILGCYTLCFKSKEQLEISFLPEAPLSVQQGRAPHIQASQFLQNSRDPSPQESLAEQREYYPGDDPRHINWKVFARFDQLFVRIPEESNSKSKEVQCHLFIDFHSYPKPIRKFVFNSYLSSFLEQIKRLHLDGYQVSIYLTNIDGPYQAHPYSASTEESIFYHAASSPIPHAESKTTIERLISTAYSQARHCSQVIFSAEQSSLPQMHSHPNIAQIPLALFSPAILHKKIRESSKLWQVFSLLPYHLWLRWLMQKHHNKNKLSWLELEAQIGAGNIPKALQHLYCWHTYYKNLQKQGDSAIK